MTIGTTIKNARKAAGMTQKQLAAVTGIDDATIRKYESGKLNPKPGTLEKLANGMDIDVNVLLEGEIDSTKAMIKLFSVFNSYDGTLLKGKDLKKEIKKKDFNENDIYISFKSLQPFLQSWYQQYEIYQNVIEKSEKIKDTGLKEQYIGQAKDSFNRWMLNYPKTESNQYMIEFYKIMDEASNYIATHPLNDPENPVSLEEKERCERELKSIYAKLRPTKTT